MIDKPLTDFCATYIISNVLIYMYLVIQYLVYYLRGELVKYPYTVC